MDVSSYNYSKCRSKIDAYVKIKIEIKNRQKDLPKLFGKLLINSGCVVSSAFFANFAVVAVGVVDDYSYFKWASLVTIIPIPLAAITVYGCNHYDGKLIEKYDEKIAELRDRRDKLSTYHMALQIFKSMFCCC